MGPEWLWRDFQSASGGSITTTRDGTESPTGSQVWRLAGQLRSTYTNLDTGYAVSWHEAGVLTQTTYPDGSEYILFAGKPGPPMAAPNWVLTGAQKVYITPGGDVTWTFNGRAEEVCAMLNH